MLNKMFQGSPGLAWLVLCACSTPSAPEAAASAGAQAEAAAAQPGQASATAGSADSPAGAGAGAAKLPAAGVSGAAGSGGAQATASPDESSEDAGAAEPPTPDAGAAEPSEPPPAVACPVSAPRTGETRATLMHDGRMREFLVYIPSSYDNTRPVPLVLNFHGATMTATQQRDFSGMNATADAKGFIVVYPQGVGNTWNAGACCGEAQTSNVDDVGFAKAMIAAVQETACIDPQRVYSAGFSNGGRMSYRLGCEAAELFAAIAPVAGTKSFPDDMNTPGCQPAAALSLIDIMGSADPRSAAQPGQIAEWVAFNGCSDASPTESFRNGAHVCSTYSQCDEGTSVTYCIVDGGDHCWPGSYPCILGNTSRPEEFSANDLIWELFERSTR